MLKVARFINKSAGSERIGHEEALDIESCPASGGGGSDGLTVDGIGYVAGSKHARDVGGGSGQIGNDVALLIGGYAGEELCVGLMAYGEEESVDGNVEVLFVFRCRRFSTRWAPSRYSLTEEAGGVGVEQDLDFGIVEYALLHHLRGAQMGFADDKKKRRKRVRRGREPLHAVSPPPTTATRLLR